MPKGYSKDLRWRIVWKYLQNRSVKDISLELYVCTRTVERVFFTYSTLLETFHQSFRDMVPYLL